MLLLDHEKIKEGSSMVKKEIGWIGKQDTGQL